MDRAVGNALNMRWNSSSFAGKRSCPLFTRENDSNSTLREVNIYFNIFDGEHSFNGIVRSVQS